MTNAIAESDRFLQILETMAQAREEALAQARENRARNEVLKRTNKKLSLSLRTTETTSSITLMIRKQPPMTLLKRWCRRVMNNEQPRMTTLASKVH